MHIRNRIKGGPTWYNVRAEEAVAKWNILTHSQHNAENLYVSSMAPTEKTLIQGEIQQGLNGLDLYYTLIAKPMREALAVYAKQVSGIMASSLLACYLCPNSHEWVEFLLKAYPLHVIEFSTYGVNWGTLPGYNTVTWEVRAY